MADEDDRSGGTRSAGGVELLVESVVRGWSTTSSGVFGGVCGRVVVGGGPRRCVGAVGGPVGFRFWRFGRIVPPRAPSRCRHNRAIARESPGASGVPVRTILPGRRFPFWAGPAAAVRERRRSGEGGWCVTFGCAPAPARPGRGVIAPFRGGRGERDGRGGCGGGPARSGVHGPARGGETPAGIAAAPEYSTAREYRGSGPPANRDPSRSES